MTCKKAQHKLEEFEEAIPLWTAIGDRQGEAATITSTGLTYWVLGENQKALDLYNQALLLARAIEFPKIEATTLFGLARVELKRANLLAARNQTEAALGIIESLRRQLTSNDLRASFLTSIQGYYNFT
jgi:tetratricopeptide (TPR) repeat protein